MSSAEPHYLDAKNSTKKQDKKTPKKNFQHVMCFGTFDIFHPGHHYYLSEANKHADHMTVVIARDHRVFSGKGRDPIHTETLRRDIVERAFPDAQVILGHESDIFAPIRELRPDILVFGYDQKVPEDKIHELFPNIEIVRVIGHEVEKWKSSILRNQHIEKDHTK
ncbi:adenylyltransferase/cytidyltransferase family protein [Candidatus Gracilibacteria bacterium]|nr:adenylyltransferase/cytidyltransferase family protein [Candidatus Gracilibacteria bacterium]